MTEEINKSKLDTKLVPGDSSKTSTSKKLLFTDYSIDRHVSDFINPETNKVRYRRYRTFDGKAPKGLNICQYEKSKVKFFVLQYWFNGKPNRITIGEFVQGKFGVKEAQDRYNELYQKHTNDRGIWTSDPKAFTKARDKKVFDKEQVKLKQKSVTEVIEYASAENFPSNKKEGGLAATTIKELTLPLMGYNKRTLLMAFSDDKKGFVKIFYKGSKFYGIAKPENSDDLFNKFPPGHGIIKTRKLSKHKNMQEEVSIYDDEMGSVVMENLSTQLVRNFINSKPRSYSKKRNLRRAYKYIWNLANNMGWISGDLKDPTNDIDIPLPDKVEFSGARFNHQRFTPEQLTAIWNALVKNEAKHPFSTEALMFMLVTGKRKPETLKIKKSYIDYTKGIILMPHHIMKTKVDHEIAITEPVKWVLDKIAERLKEPKYQKYNFIPHLFPSTKTKSTKLYDQEYVNGEGTRLKDVRDCWLDVTKETGIDGAIKMLRKTFISLGMIHLKEHWKVQMLSGHTKAATIDTSYNKSTREQQKEYAEEVADKIFNFVK